MPPVPKKTVNYANAWAEARELAWAHRGGLSIGLLNYARDLHGWQIGLLNYADNNPAGLRLLPLFNREW